MPDLAWNKATWDGAYDWSQHGHEWSNTWGNSQGMFFTTLLPRIAASLPAQSVLEIAPGHGRVTAMLLPFCTVFHGIDLSTQCTEFCQTRFATHPNASFHTNDGLSLQAIANHRFNLVFSYDSLVHADLPVFEAYIPQILALLAPGGIAFLHHSNLAAFPEVTDFQHRSTTTSAPRNSCSTRTDKKKMPLHITGSYKCTATIALPHIICNTIGNRNRLRPRACGRYSC